MKSREAPLNDDFSCSITDAVRRPSAPTASTGNIEGATSSPFGTMLLCMSVCVLGGELSMQLINLNLQNINGHSSKCVGTF